MKILHAVLSQSFYGSERHCAELAEAQARNGNDVEIIVQGAWSDCAREMRKAVAHASIIGAGTLKLTAIPSWLPAWLHRPYIGQLLRRARPDIVHTHLTPAARRVGRTGQRLGIPHVTTLHLTFEASEIGDSDGVVTLSASQRETVPDSYRGEVTTIWNWLSPAVAEAMENVSAEDIILLRRSWVADEQTFVFGTVGRLMPEKGMDWLIRAFRLAFPGGMEDVRLVIAGDGMEEAALKELARDEPRIIFAGRQSAIALYYLSFDVFVSAARFEPFGLSIIEALGASLPMIATRIHGTVDFVTDPRVRWVTPDDEPGLALAMVDAAEGHRTRCDYNMRPFQVTRAASQTEALYRRILEKRASQPETVPQAETR